MNLRDQPTEDLSSDKKLSPSDIDKLMQIVGKLQEVDDNKIKQFTESLNDKQKALLDQYSASLGASQKLGLVLLDRELSDEERYFLKSKLPLIPKDRYGRHFYYAFHSLDEIFKLHKELEELK